MSMRTSRWAWPLPGVSLERELRARDDAHAGAFGAARRFDVHTGVDLYCGDGQIVVAVEAGVVVGIEVFTGPNAGSPWWHETHAVLVEGESGVVLYGEIEPHAGLVMGARLDSGEPIGRVVRVLRKDKGTPTTMLHLELYAPGTRASSWWRLDEPRPEALRDPTERLLESVVASAVAG
jgi:hypothetical protein